jgi:hypothetical protein
MASKRLAAACNWVFEGPTAAAGWFSVGVLMEWMRLKLVAVNGDGGADRDRTCDLLIANETLYQLSYDPNQFIYNDLRRF